MNHTGSQPSTYTVHAARHPIGTTASCSLTQRWNRRRRRVLLLRRILFTTAAVAAAILIILVLTGFSDSSSSSVRGYKYYTAVTVQYGDTRWDLAAAHMTDTYPSVKSYIREVKRINSMKSDTIYYGQKLILPYYSTEFK